MKRLILPALMLGTMSLGAWARTLEAGVPERVALPEGLLVTEAALSPDGTFAVVSDAATTGLQRLDLATGQTRLLTAYGSLLGLQISADGKRAIYRSHVTGSDNLRRSGVESVDLSSGAVTRVAEPTRNLTGFALDNASNATAIDGARVNVKRMAGSKAQAPAAVGINRGHLVVTVGGKTTEIDPQGRGSYLWPSLSPDGTKVVYYKAQDGCFVCNLDGSDARALGYIHAPKWLDNSMIIGMQDTDDGTNITASAVVASDLQGNMQTLTDDSVIAMYPSANADATMIVFTDNAGGMYRMAIK